MVYVGRMGLRREARGCRWFMRCGSRAMRLLGKKSEGEEKQKQGRKREVARRFHAWRKMKGKYLREKSA